MAADPKKIANLGMKEVLQIFLILLLLFVASLAHYVIFHAIVEIGSVIVAFSIFLLAWNSREFHKQDFIISLGIGFLFIAALDLIHLFTSPEFAIIKGYDVNLSQQLRIAGRFLEAVTFAFAFSSLSKKVHAGTVFWGYLVAFVGLLLSIIIWRSFPAAYSLETGATFFKNASDIGTILVFFIALVILFRNRREFSPLLVSLFFGAILFQSLGIAIHTPFTGQDSLANFFGLSFRLVAFFLLYRAIIGTGLMDPYSLLFRNLLKKEELLKESEQRYRTVADNTYDWEFWIGPKHEFLYVSPSAKIVTGHEAKEFMARPRLFQEIVHPDDWSLFEKHRIDMEQQNNPGRLEFRIIRPDKSVRWIAHVCQPIFDANKNFLGIRGSNRDITRRKLAEDELKAIRKDLEKQIGHRTKQLSEANIRLEQDKEQLIEFYKYLGAANRKISILLDLYKAPAGKRNRQRIVNYITSTIMNISRASAGFFYGYDEDRKAFSLLQVQGKGEDDKWKPKFASTRSREFLESCRKNPRRICGRIEEQYREIFHNAKILKYFVALPLEKDKKMLGLILLGFKSKSDINTDDFEFYDIFTILASQSLARGNGEYYGK